MTSSGQWDAVWKKERCVSDYVLRWYDYLEGLSKSFLPSKKKVLETGSGSGGGIAIFAKYGHEAFGLDISPVAVEKASGMYKDVNFTCKDLFDMPYEDNSFDVLFNSGLIEHFEYPSNVEAVKAMSRVVKPGGKIIISVPNKLCPWYMAGKKLLIATGKWPYGFEDDYSPALLRSCVKEVPGLKLERMFGLQALPMLALPEFELIPLKYRKAIASLEKFLPLKEYYSYAIVAECVKER